MMYLTIIVRQSLLSVFILGCLCSCYDDSEAPISHKEKLATEFMQSVDGTHRIDPGQLTNGYYTRFAIPLDEETFCIWSKKLSTIGTDRAIIQAFLYDDLRPTWEYEFDTNGGSAGRFMAHSTGDRLFVASGNKVIVLDTDGNELKSMAFDNWTQLSNPVLIRDTLYMIGIYTDTATGEHLRSVCAVSTEGHVIDFFSEADLGEFDHFTPLYLIRYNNSLLVLESTQGLIRSYLFSNGLKHFQDRILAINPVLGSIYGVSVMEDGTLNTHFNGLLRHEIWQYDENQEVRWKYISKSIDRSNAHLHSDVLLLANGDLVIYATIYDHEHDFYRFFIERISPRGEKIWKYDYRTPTSSAVRDIVEGPDGDLFVIGNNHIIAHSPGSSGFIQILNEEGIPVH